MSRRIVYIGLERCDFIYHLSTILSLRGNVLVVDNSISGDLFSAVCKNGEKTAEWNNITYARNVDVEKSDTSYYEHVIIYAGSEPYSEKLDNATLLVMPDYTKNGVKLLEKLAATDQTEQTLIIMRDYCTKKLTDKSIATLVGINPKAIVGHLNLSIQDVAAYVTLTHNGHQNIKGVSDNMLEALTYVVSKFFAMDDKKAAKLVMDAKKIK